MPAGAAIGFVTNGACVGRALGTGSQFFSATSTTALAKSSHLGAAPRSANRRKPPTEMSSSRAGQRTPAPPPIILNCARASVDASASLRKLATGTWSTRPSLSTTIKRSPRDGLRPSIRTDPSVLSLAEVFTPCLQEVVFSLVYNSTRFFEVGRPKMAIARDLDGIEPELRDSVVSLDMNVWPLRAIPTVEEEPKRPFCVNGRHCTRLSGLCPFREGTRPGDGLFQSPLLTPVGGSQSYAAGSLRRADRRRLVLPTVETGGARWMPLAAHLSADMLVEGQTHAGRAIGRASQDVALEHLVAIPRVGRLAPRWVVGKPAPAEPHGVVDADGPSVVGEVVWDLAKLGKALAHRPALRDDGRCGPRWRTGRPSVSYDGEWELVDWNADSVAAVRFLAEFARGGDDCRCASDNNRAAIERVGGRSFARRWRQRRDEQGDLRRRLVTAKPARLSDRQHKAQCEVTPVLVPRHRHGSRLPNPYVVGDAPGVTRDHPC